MPTRILIADDHKSAIREIRTLLGANPEWEVCGEAADGQEALARANEMHPDVIVLDFAMPVMNGLMAAQEITKVQPTVPIVLNTLYNSPQVEREAKRHGIRKVVEKAHSGALVSAIHELVDKKSPLLRGSGLLNKTNLSAQPYWPGQTWDMSLWKAYQP